MLDHSSPTTKTWTDERIATLTKMWLAGRSAGEIAAHFGDGITRNAVMGQVHKHKLTRNAPKSAGTPNAAKRSPSERGNDQRVRNSIAAKAVRGYGAPGQVKAASIVHRAVTRPDPIPEFIPDDGVDVTKRLGLVDVPPGGCKWIDGDPKTPNHTFCGEPAKPGTSWCETHHRRVYPTI